MEENIKNTTLGTISLILGMIGAITIIIWFTILELNLVVPFVFGILAIITGWFAKKHGAKIGKYGLILGLIVCISEIILLLLYIWVSSWKGV